MKLGDSLSFAECETPAPALSRGLAVLRMLGEDSPASLENLSSRLNLPKASVFRLLDTLEKTGTVRRNADKLYEPLWTLQPLANDSEALRRQIHRKMPELSAETQCSAEWYEPTEAGMKLIYQELPHSELCVKAGPGFLRDWESEFEAVARLGHAFAKEAKPVRQSSLYVRNGERETISAQQIRALTEKARTESVAYDEAFNTNGVRRFAAAAIDEQTHTFIGVLALAQAYRFSDLPDPSLLLQQLTKTLNG
ncbi:helix-turn-helix domain-containing protein [Puniceicoccus vermicola]|uniref:Helix-turn-helix domain-containing protein n=1 Tax=Puniceicoccus vermicola TaxID=388746 RepID=A0A7X1B4J8_9BACT|nr:helix-turn-helix domain-containing protein [Puniceicoccus vermicola]MBC2604378.1 helix-turn-helix domain-containing protein [Puniceicoccus vermicola]